VTHGHAEYKEHGFALYGQGKRILNSRNHCILNVLAEETDGQGTAANHLVESMYVKHEQEEYKFSFCSRWQTMYGRSLKHTHFHIFKITNRI
jgi:hypothetical protein